MRFLASRGAAVLVVNVGWIALAASVGLGASSSLNISGRQQIRRGERATVTVSAQTSTVRRLAVYRAPGGCARRLEDETHHVASALLLERWVTRSYAARIRLPHAHPGTHHICAYLYHRDVDNVVTDVRADFRYVAR